MYVDNRRGADSGVAALKKSGNTGGSIDVTSVIAFFCVLLGVSLAFVGTCAFGYALYLAIFFK